MSKPRTEQALLPEPPCWGSGEIPLIPAGALRRLTASAVVGVKTRKGSDAPLLLSVLSDQGWTRHVASYDPEDSELTLVDLVSRSLEMQFMRRPTNFDFVVIPEQLADVPHLQRIPLLSSTVLRLEAIGKWSNDGLAEIMTSTLIEAYERLGDVQATLDVLVTGRSWLIAAGLKVRVATFTEPSDHMSAMKLLQLRYARTLGIRPDHKYYNPTQAIWFARRLGVCFGKETSLRECAKGVGLSGERFRQVMGRIPVPLLERRFPTPDQLMDIADELYREPTKKTFKTAREKGGDAVCVRGDVERLLRLAGLPESRFTPNAEVVRELKVTGLNLQAIAREAYRASGSIGFIHRDNALEHLCTKFPKTSRETLALALDASARVSLDEGYLYYDGTKAGSFFTSWVDRVLGLRGSTSFEEIYQAAERACQYRRAHFLLPPRGVIREFFSRDSRYSLVDDLVTTRRSIPVRLDGVQGWMYEQISKAPGFVLHRGDLLERGRLVGHNGSTIGVFASFHEVFKPCGRNCVTLTGFTPRDEDVASAHARGLSLRVRGSCKAEIRKDSVVLQVVASSDMCDSGLLAIGAASTRMLDAHRFKIFYGRNHHGHVGWSKNVTTGWDTALRFAGVAPGDSLTITFDIPSLTAVIKPA